MENSFSIGFKDKEFEYQPFYVGKGTKNRDIIHLCPFMLKRKNHKSSMIKSIINEIGELPIHFRIYENLSELEAISLEKDIIRAFGRLDLGTGILCNHTDGGDGANNLSLETRRKIGYASRKRVYQYSMGGIFIKEWSSITEVGDIMNVITGNISTSIKRGGSCCDFLWSYKYLGEKIDSKIKYQMPIKYVNIKQVCRLTGEVIAIHKNSIHAAQSLRLTNPLARNKILECVTGRLKSAYGYYWTISDTYEIPKKRGFRAVCQFTENGFLIGEYETMMDAVRKTGIPKNSIWCCCKKKQSYAGGFIWRYKNEI